MADKLIIITGVPYAYLKFGTENQTPITSMNMAQAKEYITQNEFEEGTMLPKIEAAIAYLEKNPRGSVLITSLDTVADAIKGKSGTIITA
jgi:carbamate kinase